MASDTAGGASFAGLSLDRPRLMGIVNVTPDSFSDGGAWIDPGRAVEHGLALAAEGADIVDVGGESTRPGSAAVDAGEELRRVLPVVQGLARQGLLISIDTRRAEVMRAALDAGARIVNDVSALRDDPGAMDVVAASGACVVLMHRRGRPDERYAGPAYTDVVGEVQAFLLARAEACLVAGIRREAIALDPGIGFGKVPDEDLRLILGVPALCRTGYPVLIGASRKSFLGRITGVEIAAERVPASLAVAFEAARRGAAILRVHDVAATRQVLQVAAALGRVEASDAQH